MPGGGSEELRGGSWLMIGKDEFGVRALILRKGQDPSGDVWEIVGRGVWNIIVG